MIEIIPTVVPHSFEDVRAAAERNPFARSLHVDFADGLFAPNTTWFPASESTLAIDGVILEAHLMVKEPRQMGELLAASGFARIIGHIEAMGEDVEATLSAWRLSGARGVGLGTLFATHLEAIYPYIPKCDVIQMMSIASIGVQGIPYESSAPDKIALLHREYPDLLIADDGGVSLKNIADLARAGVRRFCVGSALSKSPDPASTYRELLALAESGAHPVRDLSDSGHQL